jgi:DNA-binding NarL/FixJ family response regulator
MPEATHSLTQHECTIVAMIVEGLPNRAIADRLDVTRLTVSERVATILWKLGLGSRREIVTWAITQA